MSLGGDCAAGGAAPAGGWKIRIADRHDAALDAPGPVVSLTSGGLATSGTSARRWNRGGRAVHHVVDPTTGWPAAEVWRTVSVAASSCVDANVASTAAIVLGPEAPAWLDARGLPARLVAAAGAAVTSTGGWPADPAPLGPVRTAVSW